MALFVCVIKLLPLKRTKTCAIEFLLCQIDSACLIVDFSSISAFWHTSIYISNFSTIKTLKLYWICLRLLFFVQKNVFDSTLNENCLQLLLMHLSQRDSQYIKSHTCVFLNKFIAFSTKFHLQKVMNRKNSIDWIKNRVFNSIYLVSLDISHVIYEKNVNRFPLSLFLYFIFRSSIDVIKSQ